MPNPNPIPEGPIRFGPYNRIPRYRSWLDQAFHGIAAVNFARSGEILWAPKGETPRPHRAPVFWYTWPGSAFTYGNANDDGWDHTYATFRGPLAHQLFRHGWLDPDPPQALIHPRDPEVFMAVFDRLLAALDHGDEPGATARLLDLVVEVTRERRAPHRTPRDIALARIIEGIRADPRCPVLEERASTQCLVSVPHFRRLFKAACGMPLHRYQIRCRLDLARKILRETSLPIAEVADSVGMPDLFHFCKAFRKTFGTPPATWRRETLNPR